jgi:hypothetical protein
MESRVDDQTIYREGGVKTNTRFILVLAAVGVALACVAAQATVSRLAANQIGNLYLVTGYTGHLLGEEITIKGHKTKYTIHRLGHVGSADGTGKNTFQVEEINREKNVLPI